MLASIGPRLAAGAIGLIILVVYLGVPLLAVIDICRKLRGGSRIGWALLIVVATLFIPLIGLILAILWFVFRRRFIAVQRGTR